MTQKSLPQQGHLQDNLTPDAGPYSAARWAEVWAAIFTSSPDHGPIGETGDTTLKVTQGVSTQIFVNVGDALVGGRVFQSSLSQPFILAAPVANTRIDVVVVVQNESSSPVSAGIASGNALAFPADLTDYGGSPSIPPYSARLAVLTGTASASPVAPVLDQNPDLLHMIPLAQLTLNTSTITDIEDTRVYSRSQAGGTIYVPEYYWATDNPTVLTQNVYSGRARMIPFSIQAHIATSGYEGTVTTQTAPDPTFGVHLYASFFVSSVTDFDLLLPIGQSLRAWMVINGFYPNPNWLEFSILRGGYVDNAGVAQAMDTAEKVYDMHFVLIQLLDAVPTPDYGELPSP